MGVLRLLLDNGANPDATDKFAWKPLHWALSRGHKNAVEILLNGIADIQDIDLEKVFRFKKADQAGFEEAKRMILERQKQYQAGSD
jgi:ankyrin repeat protein